MKVRIILLFLILLSGSCSTQILVPGWFDPKVDHKKHNWLDYEDITIIAENLEVNDMHIVFDIEIKNETNYRLRFDPELVYYLGSSTSYPTSNPTYQAEFESKLKKHYALSEREVARDLERQVKSQKTTNLITGILSAGLLVFDAAMGANIGTEVSSKFFSQEAIRSMVTIGGLAAMDIVREQAAMTAADAREDLHFLSDEMIDEGVIFPGKTYRGKLFFTSTRDKYFRLIIPVESNDFALDFRWADGKDQRRLRKRNK
jgi:hypothetical protein